MLWDATIRSFVEVGTKLGALDPADVRKQPPSVRLSSGAEVIFRSADDPDRLRGPNLSGAWLDEASIMGQGAYEIVIAALREGGEFGWLSATFTPRGRQHWTYEVFGTERPDTELIQARTQDNPFLPPEFFETIKRQYGENSVFARQELSGEFIDGGGTIFQRAWFKVLEKQPLEFKRRVRAWDMAATAPKEGTDPDWTVGTLMGRTHDDEYVVLDVKRLRDTPLAVERVIRRCAEEDGRGVDIFMEEEGGSSGKITTDHYLRTVLAGFVYKGIRSTGPKEERARPLSGMAEAGHVGILRGEWNRAWLDELDAFPIGTHDDMVDSASLAYSQVAEGKLTLDVWF